MAKYYGKVGFVIPTIIRPGVWKEVPQDRPYPIELKNLNNRYVSPDNSTLYQDISISNQASVIADPFLNSYYQYIKYVELDGVKWRVKSVDATKRPRLILQLGEVYTDVQQT